MKEVINDDSNSSKTTTIVIVVLVVVIALAAAWYFGMYKPAEEAKEKARLEQAAKAAAKEKREKLAAQKRVKYAETIEKANEAFSQEQWEAAKSGYSEATSLFPEQPYPLEQLAIVNAKLDEIAAREARKAAGEVENVTAASGRYYVVVSSSIDGDLAMDYGSEMAQQGESVKIIAPYGSYKYYRVSLADYGSQDQALSAAATMTSTSGDPVWVLKY